MRARVTRGGSAWGRVSAGWGQSIACRVDRGSSLLRLLMTSESGVSPAVIALRRSRSRPPEPLIQRLRSHEQHCNNPDPQYPNHQITSHHSSSESDKQPPPLSRRQLGSEGQTDSNAGRPVYGRSGIGTCFRVSRRNGGHRS